MLRPLGNYAFGLCTANGEIHPSFMLMCQVVTGYGTGVKDAPFLLDGARVGIQQCPGSLPPIRNDYGTPRRPDSSGTGPSHWPSSPAADNPGTPHLVPICFVYDGHAIYSAIDHKPKRRAGYSMKRIHNILENPQVASWCITMRKTGSNSITFLSVAPRASWKAAQNISVPCGYRG